MAPIGCRHCSSGLAKEKTRVQYEFDFECEAREVKLPLLKYGIVVSNLMLQKLQHFHLCVELVAACHKVQQQRVVTRH